MIMWTVPDGRYDTMTSTTVLGKMVMAVMGTGTGCVVDGQDFDDVCDEGVFEGTFEGMCDGDFLDYG